MFVLEDAKYYFQKAADVLDLPDRLREILITPIRVVKVDRELTDKMRKAYASVREVALQNSIDMRTAAFVLAIRRVSEAAMARKYVEEDIQL